MRSMNKLLTCKVDKYKATVMCVRRRGVAAQISYFKSRAEENVVLELGYWATVKSVSLISNIYLVVTITFQYYIELVGRIQCLDLQGNSLYCTTR